MYIGKHFDDEVRTWKNDWSTNSVSDPYKWMRDNQGCYFIIAEHIDKYSVDYVKVLVDFIL